MFAPFSRRLWASSFFALCISSAGAADLERLRIPGGDYDIARQTLVEAIEAEGLVPGPVSHFADMLQRSQADVGHGGDIYARAEIFSFCSILIAARLVREDPERIADCPMTVALFRLKGADEIEMVYRRREGETPASQAANRLLRRILERTAEMLPRRPE